MWMWSPVEGLLIGFFFALLSLLRATKILSDLHCTEFLVGWKEFVGEADECVDNSWGTVYIFLCPRQ